LESKLKELGKDASGNKEALIERLIASSQQITIESTILAETQALIRVLIITFSRIPAW
jgi:hypothetical protein